MRKILASWWRSDSHLHRLDYVLGEHASKRLYTVVFGILLSIYSAMWAAALFTRDGPASDAGRGIITVTSCILAASAIASFCGWLPTERVSLAGLAVLDTALLVAALQMSNGLIGLLVLFMYGPIGFLIGFRHGPRALTLHCAGAVAAIVVMSADLLRDMPVPPTTVVDVAVGLMLLVAGLPLASHIVFDIYRIRAIDAELDPLTDLLNRRGLAPRWQHLFDGAASTDWLMVICADLDGFKPINDTYGHRIGDVVLRRTADQIIDVVGPTAHVARTGGDEFNALLRLPHTAAPGRWHTADRIRVAVRDDQSPVSITVSVGIAAVPFIEVAAEDPLDVLRRLSTDADTAMYTAKRRGGDRTVDASTTPHRRGVGPEGDGGTTAAAERPIR
ncbi:GGDEF domain-containing protein [Gordonia sp. TBRC 11910]|uniref:GGDEF domain-containing protein n=1 Tax=Gordonia asplenii TaxID=2725283 RepID=A0A848KSE5_9ACTN|nr:GGDEF domain-containing protein [Gordonia asplenii]NMO01049.1 GGDEF domain-containing protein [Gordonia asplenii]